MAKDTSMSTLGAFYDALFDIADDQRGKYGQNAIPDLVPGAVTDNIADGIITTVAGLSGLNSISEGLEKKVQGSLSTKIFGNQYVDNWINIDSPFNEKRLSAEFTDEEGLYMAQDAAKDDTYGLNVNLTPETARAIMIDSNAFADGLVNNYWKQRKNIQAVHLIKSLGGKENVAGAAYVENRIMNGLDKDIATAISVAQESHVQSQDFKGHRKGPYVAVTDHKAKKREQDLDELDKKNKSGSLDTAMAMFAGIESETERAEFAKFYSDQFKDKLVAAYNVSVASTAEKAIKDFDNLFQYGGEDIDRKIPKLFNTSGGKNRGDFLEDAHKKVIGDFLADPSLSLSLKANITNFSVLVNDRGKFDKMIRAYSRGPGEDGTTLKMVSLGIEELRNKSLGRALSPVERENLKKLKAAQKTIGELDDFKADKNFRFRAANTAAYMYHRYKTLPPINKVLTPFNMLTGKAWLDMANLSGGLWGRGTHKPDDNYEMIFFPDDARSRTYFLTGMPIIDHKANRIQKGFYRMHVYSPGAFLGGLANGHTFQRMFHLGTDFGRNVGDSTKWKRSARFASRALNSKGYRRWLKFNHTFNTKVIHAPRILVEKMNKAIKAKINAAWVKFVKKRGIEAFSNWLALVTAGVSKVVEWTYRILNVATFGGLDKISQATMKFFMQILIGVIGGMIVFVIFGIGGLFGSGSPSSLASNLGNGGTFAPDPSYHPVLAAMGEPIGGRPGGPIVLPPIDWDDYDDLLGSACPIQVVGGGAVTYCSQGPAGRYSHHGYVSTSGNSGNYAIDMAPGDTATQAVAPEGGTVSVQGIRCLSTGGTVIGVKLTGDSGRNYIYYHVVAKQSVVGQHVDEGTVIGAMIIGASSCSDGSHIHFEVWNGGSIDPRPDAAYAVMCNLGQWTCTAEH